MVHIEKSVQSFFDKGQVQAFDLQQLRLNGTVARRLNGHPSYVLLGIELKDGTKISCIPPVCKIVFRELLLKSAICGLVAGALTYTPAQWFGGLFAGCSVHYFRAALGIPRKST